jgi:hypothetical protein
LNEETSNPKASATVGSTDATLLRDIRRVISNHLESGQRVVQVKIGRREENRIHGFLKLTSKDADEAFLLDFEAISTPRGTLSFLEVNGKKIDIPSFAGRSNESDS